MCQPTDKVTLPEDVLQRVREFPAEYNLTAGKPMREFFEEAALLGYLASRRGGAKK